MAGEPSAPWLAVLAAAKVVVGPGESNAQAGWFVVPMIAAHATFVACFQTWSRR